MRHNDIFSSFIHGIAWSTARRFIYSLPLPIVMGFAVFLGIGYLMKRTGSRSKSRR